MPFYFTILTELIIVVILHKRKIFILGELVDCSINCKCAFSKEFFNNRKEQIRNQLFEYSEVIWVSVRIVGRGK